MRSSSQLQTFAVESQWLASLPGIRLDLQARSDDRRLWIEIELERDLVDAPRGRAIVAQENGRLGAGGGGFIGGIRAE